MEDQKENKTNTKKPTAQRKVAPDVIVNCSSSKRSIDQLLADNPNRSFVYAPARSSEGSLGKRGLVPVLGTDGNRMNVGAKMICEDLGHVQAEEIKQAHDLATERFNEVKDKKQSNTRDKTAKAKKPVS